MTFHEQAIKDLEEIFNADEMAEEVVINGVKVVALIEYRKADKSASVYGNYAHHQVNTSVQRIFVREADMLNSPVVNSKIDVNGTWYTVSSAKNVMGLHTIELEVNT